MPRSLDITSTKNPLIRRIRALLDPEARKAEARMVVEGVRMLEEVLDAGVPVEVLVYDPHALAGPRGEALLDRARRHGARLVTAAPHVVAACSQVDTPQGLVAVVERSPAALSDLLNVAGLVVVVADRLQDPGNLGTIIRTADAAGATAVLATHGTVDPSNPKVVRATMGSLFHLPVVTAPAEEAVALLRQHGVRILVADQSGAISYEEADYHAPLAVVLGNEGEGPDPVWRTVAEATVRIPLYGRAESLNVAVAAALLLYEVRRTRPT